ncbi:hypothetical protein CDD83_4666 [Cordyceps sp. RAO-2017]|nr:hypothetical protein CDD83_4666 [Cordyceps sp. RAO-2017]
MRLGTTRHPRLGLGRKVGRRVEAREQTRRALVMKTHCCGTARLRVAGEGSRYARMETHGHLSALQSTRRVRTFSTTYGSFQPRAGPSSPTSNTTMSSLGPATSTRQSEQGRLLRKAA